MKKIIALILLFIAVLLFAKLAFAQSATSSAVSLTFPIVQLGNCSSTKDCKTYCDDPTHLDACIAYAKEKGFYQASTLDSNQTTILAAAKTALGCDSLDSCRKFCQLSVNAAQCSAFATAHNLRGGKVSLSSTVLQKAQQVLGCDSEDSCKTFCQQDVNKTKCAAFAHENNLRGGDETVGPGGCTSENSCKQYCANPSNFQTCSQYKQETEGTGSAHFTGPGGCTSEDSCKSFCDQNPTACHLNPAGHESAMSATGAAEIEMHTNNLPNQTKRQFPVERPPVAGSSGESTPRPAEKIEINSTGNSFPTETVKGAATHKDFWQWVWDSFLTIK